MYRNGQNTSLKISGHSRNLRYYFTELSISQCSFASWRFYRQDANIINEKYGC